MQSFRKEIYSSEQVVPHGNSISGYDWRLHPSSRWWSIARNKLSRPPFEEGAEANWIQRETMTTDAPGAFGSGELLSADGVNIKLKWLAWASVATAGTTLSVINGPGVGQTRLITAVPAENGSLTLDRPLDNWVALSGTQAPSLLAVLPSIGSKAIVGNHYKWTEVVQWYGNTNRGVMADNTFENCNVKPGGNVGAASMGGVGECYHGADPMYFTEFRGNVMDKSDGIALNDGADNHEPECRDYTGPWVRWSVIRANVFSGVSLAAKNATDACTPKIAGVSCSGPELGVCKNSNCTYVARATQPRCPEVAVHGFGPAGPDASWTTDVVAEQNVFGCGPSGNQSTEGYYVSACGHCLVRY